MAWIDRVVNTRAQLATLPSRVIEPAEQRYTLDQLAKMFSFDGNGYPFIAAQGSSAYDSFERDEHSFVDYVHSIYKTNGVVFGVILARMLLFTEARFQFQRLRKGRPGDLFSTPELEVLHKPWPNGTTGELLARAEQDVSIAGNFYAVKEAGRLRRLRPDWVQIILTSPPARAIKSDVAGYLYTPGGGVDRESPDGKVYLPHEICHWSPIPDPEAQYRGMSWLTPVLAEVQADHATTRHKLRFFQNAATPNLAVSFSENISQAQFKAFMQAMNAAHQGSNNAYKTLYLGGGADVKVIGADLRQLDFKSTQGAGETRICAAGGVPPIIVGLSEGLQSATYSNYGMARRKFGDHWARPQWRSFCAAAESLVRTPSDARLWFDDRDIAFLREDQKDVATIQSQQASTMKQLLDAGYKPESVIAAITNEDWTLLEHTGLFSVQLQPPGGAQPALPGAEGGAPPPPDAGTAPAQEQQPAGAGGESTAPTGEVTPEQVLADAGIDLQQLNVQIDALQRVIDGLGPTEARTRAERVLAAYRSAMAKWDEAQHPRGPDGKFGKGAKLDGMLDASGKQLHVGQTVKVGFSEATVVGAKNGRVSVKMEGLPRPVKARPEHVEIIDPPDASPSPAEKVRPNTPDTKHGSPIGDEDALTASVDGGYAADSLTRLTGGALAVSVYRVTFLDGTEGVIKSSRHREQVDREVLSARVGAAVGAPVPSAILDPDANESEDVPDVFMRLVPGNTLAEKQLPLSDPAVRELGNSREGKLIGLLDTIVNNGDRNNGNIIVRPDGAVAGIDHGNAIFDDFYGAHPVTGDPLPNPDLTDEPFAGNFIEDNGVLWKSGGLTKADFDAIRPKLEALADQFASLDRSDWFDSMIDRFNAIAKIAEGT